MQHIQHLSTRIRDVRRQRAAKRASAAANRLLTQDLAGYTSRSDLVELDAILSRYNDNETAEIRTILQRTPVRA